MPTPRHCRGGRPSHEFADGLVTTITSYTIELA